MTKTEKLSFINGIFKEKEAYEVLMTIFSTKIQFHKLKNFTSLERLGKEDKKALKRIVELQKGIEKINNIISKAKAENKSLTITSEIFISLNDNN
jgi:hypothetical protein